MSPTQKSGRVTVICPDYTQTCKSRADAERWVAGVEKAGHCRHVHAITEESA
jgi:hypothetical protein